MYCGVVTKLQIILIQVTVACLSDCDDYLRRVSRMPTVTECGPWGSRSSKLPSLLRSRIFVASQAMPTVKAIKPRGAPDPRNRRRYCQFLHTHAFLALKSDDGHWERCPSGS